jgi:hypothetical protein
LLQARTSLGCSSKVTKEVISSPGSSSSRNKSRWQQQKQHKHSRCEAPF